MPLDMATRLSAAGALTWWHLDDCGEFVFQVGLPVRRDAPSRRGANPFRRRDGSELLGPTGRPVCKLFVFAAREDYEWIAQDGVMNQTMKQTALDLFDTPTHCLPHRREMCGDPARTPLGPGAKFDDSGRSSGSRPDGAVPPPAKLPTFWVAPLECGGCPLLSPPNWIHCVVTVRDCVMVEERRLSLAFLDEVAYFQRRASRWCEPPVQYRFIREDLNDVASCRAHVVSPLLKMLAAEDAGVATRCRARSSLRTLVDDSGAGLDASGLDQDGRDEIRAALDAFEAFLATDAGEACRAFIARDARENGVGLGGLVSAMSREGQGNVHALGAFRSSLDGGPFAAVVHERGRPRWGPVRGTREEAADDRKTMRRAVKEGSLDALLRGWRGHLGGDEGA